MAQRRRPAGRGIGERIAAVAVVATMVGSALAAAAVSGPAGAAPRAGAAAGAEPLSLAGQVTAAVSRLAHDLTLPHAGVPERLTHPAADHAGAATAVEAPPAVVESAALRMAPTSGALYGLDVSSFQRDVDWPAVASEGATFAYSKATEGTYYTNPYFSEQYVGAYDANLVRGAYAFAIPDNTGGAAQADFFVANGGAWSADNSTLPGMLDLEANPYGAACYGLTQRQMVGWIAAFVDEYHHLTGRWAVLYTTTTWWDACAGGSTDFAINDPLWIAHYSSGPGLLPGGWPTFTFWQDSDAGLFPGDQDVFDGSIVRLRALANDNGGGVVSPEATAKPPVRHRKRRTQRKRRAAPACDGIPITLGHATLCL